MRSLQARFNAHEMAHPFLSTYIVFALSVKYQGFSEPTIRKWFYKLVDPEDYEGISPRILIPQLLRLTRKQRKDTVDTIPQG